MYAYGALITGNAVYAQANGLGGTGGGIYSSGTLTMMSGCLNYNTAGSDGGGIAVDKTFQGPATATISSVWIASNQASGKGGGFCLISGGALTMSSSYLGGNTATGGGNGGYIYTGGVYTDNRGNSGGDAIVWQ